MIDIAIIGGGPAGLAAGLYAARGGAKAVLFEELFPGGQAAKTHQIDNYPGFPEGLMGSELGMRLQQQAERFKLQIEYDGVMGLELAGPVKKIVTASGPVEAKAVILTMGAAPRKLGLSNEEALTGAGVSYCATCDGAFFKDKPVAVVGGGDTALSDAVYLSRFAKKVYLIHRRDAFRGSPALEEMVRGLSNVELILDSVPKALLGEGKLSGLETENVKTGDRQTLMIDGLFVAVGVLPRSEIVLGQLSLNEGNYIITDERMQTSLSGVYAAGDVRNTPLRQVVTAVADGAVAATMALEYIGG